MRFKNYPRIDTFDELINHDNTPRPDAKILCDYLSGLSDSELQERQVAAEFAIQTMGITFTVYSEGENIDRAWPFDMVPRIIEDTEWKQVEAGLKQRLQALNLFIHDLYSEQRVLKDKIIPAELIHNSKNFRQQCVGITPTAQYLGAYLWL